jgi:hypothetical protein
MAWTENPKDEDAKKIAKDKHALGAAVAAAVTALTDPKRSDDESVGIAEAIQCILGFAVEPLQLGAGKFATTVDEAMTFVRTGFGKELPTNVPGGAAIEEDWLPGFRFYVLGPPTSLNSLSDLGEHASEQLYHMTAGLRVAAAGSSADVSELEVKCLSIAGCAWCWTRAVTIPRSLLPRRCKVAPRGL